jgi:hypothetical protein
MRLKRHPKRSTLSRAAQSTRSAATDNPKRTGAIAAGLASVGAAFAVLRDRGRRRKVRDLTAGKALGATAGIRHAHRDYDDVTLAQRVESEVLGKHGAPKGSISVNAQFGVVELRGQVETADEIEALGKAAAKVAGVKDVHNLLHTPGTPAGHSPPSDPAEVRARAEEEHARFEREHESS